MDEELAEAEERFYQVNAQGVWEYTPEPEPEPEPEEQEEGGGE